MWIGLLVLAAAAPERQVPPSEQPILREVARAVTAERIERDVRKLVSFGTRHTLSDTRSETRGIGAARRWIKAEFERIGEGCGGCLEVSFQSRVVQAEPRIPQPTEIVNVVAIQRGTTDPGRYVVITGDIDSRVSDVMNATSDAPGADDNASGMAAVIEAARVLSRYKFPASIVYAGLSGEEQGLFGGKIFAEEAKRAGWRIEAVLNNDMIGNIEGSDGIVDNLTARVFSEGTPASESLDEARRRRQAGGEVDSPSRNLARYVAHLAEGYVPSLHIMLVYRPDRVGRGGHHLPFNSLGFAAIRIMEAHENYRRQHQDVRVEGGTPYGDRVEGVSFPYAAKLTALNAVALAAMAWAPAPPSAVELRGAASPDASLRWKKPAGSESPGFAGFKVYWRPTDAPAWTGSIFVGDLTEATLPNLVIDNHFLGVASVASEGFESPVALAQPSVKP